MPLLFPAITILILLVIVPCNINCLIHFISAQVKLQHAAPFQQGYLKLQLTTENITYPQIDTIIRTLRLETSKRGRANAHRCPSSAETSQRDLNVPIPKELGLLSLKGSRLGSYKRKKESRVAEAKRQRKEKPAKIEPRKVREPQVKQTALLASPVYIGQAQG